MKRRLLKLLKRRPRISKNVWLLLLILALLGASIWVLTPSGSTSLDREGNNLGMRLGLDLQGGTYLVYQADFPEDYPGSKEDAMKGAVDNIRKRVDAYGVTEPIIQTQHSGDDYRILIQLPGIASADAKQLIGQTAQLEFKERVFDAGGGFEDQPTGLTGDDFGKAYIGEDPESTLAPRPVANFEFKGEAVAIFDDLTTRIHNEGNQLAILLDEEELFSGGVETPITEGKGYIRGTFTYDNDWDAAHLLVIQLNSGALPVSLGSWQEDGTFTKGYPLYDKEVSATLGADFIDKIILAGEIGLGVLLLFMILYYRLPGVLASLALLVYVAGVLAIFKAIPVTLTLAGLAGFILSIGMAVDANVLIFERLKEELRGGRTLKAAVETGFNRAWIAIRDSNISTFIICGILYWFGSSIVDSPPVMGFAVALAIGVALSMFTAIVVTRTFLRFSVGRRVARRLSLFGVERRVTGV